MTLQTSINRKGVIGAVQKILGVVPFVPRGALLSVTAKDFMLSNEDIPVVRAKGRGDGGTCFILANRRRFELSARDIELMPMPIWGKA